MSGDPFLAGGQLYYRFDRRTRSAGVGGFPVNENVELGFLFGQQPSTLVAGGTVEKEIGDFTTNTYHGYFGYNFGPGDAKVRPYFLFGLGATNYGGTDYTGPNGRSGTLAAFTQFSTTWGAGVKGYGSGHVGYRAGASWTPTYIKSTRPVGCTRTGAATLWAIRSTQTSSRRTAACSSSSNRFSRPHRVPMMENSPSLAFPPSRTFRSSPANPQDQEAFCARAERLLPRGI